MLHFLLKLLYFKAFFSSKGCAHAWIEFLLPHDHYYCDKMTLQSTEIMCARVKFISHFNSPAINEQKVINMKSQN